MSYRRLLIAQDVAVGTPTNPEDVPAGAIAFFDEENNVLDPAADSIMNKEVVHIVRGRDNMEPILVTIRGDWIKDRRKIDYVARQQQISVVGHNNVNGNLDPDEIENGEVTLTLSHINTDRSSVPINRPYNHVRVQITKEAGDSQEDIADKIIARINELKDQGCLYFIDSVSKIDDGGSPAVDFGVQITFEHGVIGEVGLEEKSEYWGNILVSSDEGAGQPYNPGTGNPEQVKELEFDAERNLRGDFTTQYYQMDFPTYAQEGQGYDLFHIQLESFHSHKVKLLANKAGNWVLTLAYPQGGTNISDVEGPVITN